MRTTSWPSSSICWDTVATTATLKFKTICKE
jgi:hypothetical protein